MGGSQCNVGGLDRGMIIGILIALDAFIGQVALLMCRGFSCGSNIVDLQQLFGNTGKSLMSVDLSS